MANIPLKSIQFPGLDDTYTVPSNAGELPYNKNATYPADTVGKALQNIGDSSAPAIIETAQGSIASFDDGADNVPVKDLIAEIVPLQSGSGDPSPDNVRAISGWTGCNITVADVNQWDEEWELGAYDTTTGAKIESYQTIRSKNYIKCKPSTDYCFNTNGSTILMFFYDSNLNFITYHQTSSPSVPFVYQTPADCHFMTFRMGTAYGTEYNDDISINYPSTETAYHTGATTHTISFASAGTVYGGRLDVTSGVLTVDGVLTNLGTLNWAKIANQPEFYAIVPNALFIAHTINYMCSAYKSTEPTYSGSTTSKCICANAYGLTTIIVNDSSYADADAFKSAMVGVQFVHKLAEPQTYQLTPTEVSTLLKNNNIWADTGDVTVEYVADTKTFIENLVNA